MCENLLVSTPPRARVVVRRRRVLCAVAAGSAAEEANRRAVAYTTCLRDSHTMLAAIETLLPAFLSAARLLTIAAVLACLGVPRAAASVAGLQLAITMALRLCSHESVGGRAAFAAALHAGAIVALLMLSPAYPGACSLVCAAVYVSTYAGLARGAPSRTVDLSGQVVVVTGSSAGIGLETATSLLGLGATVVFACRSEVRAQAAIRHAVAATGRRRRWRRSVAAASRLIGLDYLVGEVEPCLDGGGVSDAASHAVFAPLDLSDCDSVRRCAAALTNGAIIKGGRLDALVCNAGCMHATRQLDAQGWELSMGSNHLGHHLLIQLLLPALRAAPAGRVVSVSSSTHKAPLGARRRAGGVALAAALRADLMSDAGYSMFEAYSKSKLAQLLATRGLQRRELAISGGEDAISGGEAAGGGGAGGVCFVSCHPGNSFTDITRHFPAPVRLSYQYLRFFYEGVQVAPADAANSSVHAVCRAVLDRMHGQYLERCVPVAPSAVALDEQLEREITARSDALVAPWLRPVDAHTS